MPPITFIDTEIDPNNRKILDIGAVKDDGSLFHQASVGDFTKFVQGVDFVCGHNILNHDIKYIGKILVEAGVKAVVDTLYLSPLLFPTKPYHALLKDDKLQVDEWRHPDPQRRGLLGLQRTTGTEILKTICQATGIHEVCKLRDEISESEFYRVLAG
jgi:hypothetical protein